VGGLPASSLAAHPPALELLTSSVGRLDRAGGMSRRLRRRKDYAGAQKGPYEMSKKDPRKPFKGPNKLPI
jgi:hypothetical protein